MNEGRPAARRPPPEYLSGAYRLRLVERIKSSLPVFLRYRQQRFVILFHLWIIGDNRQHNRGHVLEIGDGLGRWQRDRFAAVLQPGLAGALDVSDAVAGKDRFRFARFFPHDRFQFRAERLHEGPELEAIVREEARKAEMVFT